MAPGLPCADTGWFGHSRQSFRAPLRPTITTIDDRKSPGTDEDCERSTINRSFSDSGADANSRGRTRAKFRSKCHSAMLARCKRKGSVPLMYGAGSRRAAGRPSRQTRVAQSELARQRSSSTSLSLCQITFG